MMGKKRSFHERYLGNTNATYGHTKCVFERERCDDDRFDDARM